MGFPNAQRGLRIAGTDFKYLSEGAYGLVFVDQNKKRIRKVYRYRDGNLQHSNQVFTAEVRAYEIASANNELRILVPLYFGVRPAQMIIDSRGSDVTSEVYPDLAFEAEFIECNFQKKLRANNEYEKICALFQRYGISHVTDISVCLRGGHIIKVIDFATQEIVPQWE